METPVRTEDAIESGQRVVTQLLREPVKTALREAIAEEAVTIRREPDEQPRAEASQSAEGPSGGSKLGTVVALALVASIAYLLVRRRDDSDETAVTRPSDVDEQTAAGDRVEAEAPVDTEK